MQGFKNFVTSAILLGSLSLGAFASNAPQAEQRTPLIVPQLLNLVKHKQCFDQAAEEYCADLQIEFEATGVPWLDLALLAKLDMQQDAGQQAPSSIAEQLQRIEQQADAWLSESYADIQEARAAPEPYFIAYDYQDSLRFIAQRNQLASFKQFFYTYSGGAHGMHHTSYALYDLDTRQQLLLPDLLQRFAETKLLEKLRELYLEDYPDYAQSWLSGSLAEQTETLLTDNFVFDEQGLTFSYAPYVLGPYSEGEIGLTLYYSQLQDILKPEYLLGN